MVRKALILTFVSLVSIGSSLPVAGVGSTAYAAEVDKATQEKLVKKFELIRGWATNAQLVAAVKAHNTQLSADARAMTQEKWKGLAVLDPFVRGLTKNETAQFLKAEAQKDDSVSEAFVSGADGLKVAFLAKTSSWSHKGRPKHDDPMQGKDWKGSIEVDESTGVQQVQLSVPVLDGGKPIGSLVVGFSLAKIK